MTNALDSMLAQVEQLDPDLARRLAAEIENRSAGVGLVWEHHQPESVTLPGLAPRKGSKVMLLPPRGVDAAALRRSKKKADKEAVDPLWGTVWIARAWDGENAICMDEAETETITWPREDLVSVANFDDAIYPGLVKTGEVRRGSDGDSEHVVINAENYHALQMLTYTHRGKIDAIYIDPPYNTGAKDWKYNNAFVDTDDKFRHSKWLTFMERRLLVAKELLNPEDSVLIVTIDEKEYLNLGVLLRQTFPEARIQMVSSVINRTGVARDREFGRSDEYVYMVMLGSCGPDKLVLGAEWFVTNEVPYGGEIHWRSLRRIGTSSTRQHSPGCFYPIFVFEDADGQAVIDSIGDAISLDADPALVKAPVGTVAIWPQDKNGAHGRWQTKPASARELWRDGYIRLGKFRGSATTPNYLARGEREKIESGAFIVVGRDVNGAVVVEAGDSAALAMAPTTWNIKSHDAARGGTNLIQALHGDKRFTFPKSLYAVEDALRFFVKDKPDATILDFFAGSGTTAHAVMRLNKQDGGRRRSISVTNNEVSADEIAQLTAKGLRPGDPEWDALGIADYVTKPRIEAAVTGKRASDGEPVKGDYKFTDEFPMKDGFAANASFWTLTYEDREFINVGLAFTHIAPLLWMQAGQRGRIIEHDASMREGGRGFDIADTYAVLFDVDRMHVLADELTNGEHAGVAHVFVVTDHEAWWQDANSTFVPLVGAQGVHRLYSSYLDNFTIEGGK